MQTFLAGLAIGLVIGANVGILVAGLCKLAKDTDEPSGDKSQTAQDQQPHGEVVVIHRAPHIA